MIDDPPFAPTAVAETSTDADRDTAKSEASVVRSETSRAALPGYVASSLLGRGGMGEVVLARDARIGRDVAVKRLREDMSSELAVGRFLREARIQARLEHPAIVPVHELGHDANGRPFFTMKRLVGVTLAELVASDPPPPRQRLLRAFADVCSAVEFAHARGVVH